MIEGYGNIQSLVESLDKDHPVYLESSDNHIVNLNVIDFNSGDFRINQAILQPEVDPIEGLTYQLKIDNLDLAESVPYTFQKDSKPILFKVEAIKDQEPARLLADPKLKSKSTVFYGCGPAINAVFEFITDSNVPVLVKTELVNITDNTTKTYFLKTREDDTLVIGHGMCSGAFSYRPEHLYKVRFSLMNTCNSYEDEWSEWIEFESPYESRYP